MYNKLTQSQSTLVSTRDHRFNYYNPRDEQTMMKNPFSQNVPLKFPKNHIRKQTSQNMLSQTVYKLIKKAKTQNHLALKYTTMQIGADFSKMLIFH